MSSRKVVTDPSFKGKGTSDVSGNVINQLSHAVSDMNVHSAQDDGWEEYGKKSKNKNKNTALKQWGPQHSNPKAWGNSDTLQKLGLQSHGGLGRGSGQTRPMAPPDPRKHPGRGFIKPQSSSNQAPDPHYFVPPAVVPLPLNNGRGWPARPASVNPVSNQVPVNDEVDDGGEESEDVDDTDDELLSDGFDSDESQKSHETRKKNRWFKDLFHSLDGLTVEQINEPERQWHCPACKDGPGAIDWYRGLLPLISHAKTKRSKRVKLHRELAELLEEELKKRGTSAVPAGEIFGKWKGLAEIADKEIVWPPMVIVMNTRLERDENEKWIGMGNQELLDYFSAYSALKARHSYGPQGHRGMSVLIFEASAVGYAEAERLSKHFEDNSRDRVAWERNRVPFYSGGKRQLYGYMAEKQDMDNFNQHSQGKTKLKFEMRSYQEMVVSQMKQMSEDNQQLIWLRNKIAKEQKNKKALEESLGVVTEKLRRTMDENRIVKLKTKTHHEQNKEEKSGDAKYQNPQSVDGRGDHEPYRTGQVVLHLGNKLGGGFHVVTSGHDSPSSFALESDLIRSNKNHAVGTHVENQIDSNTVVGSLNMTHGGQVVSDSSGVSQILSQSTTLFTPTRYQQESILDSEFRYSGRDLISVADSVSKQDIVVKIRENEEEILHLKKHLTEYSRKEAQISNEKYALENRISYMRLAFDQKQQDFVLAASEAVSYRQDIMEENVRLTYTLQAAQQERSAFITSLMPLLTGYSLQPPVADAQSIVSNIKVLFRHLQEQLLVTEGKLKESQYQLAPWRSDIKDGLELVPQPTYSDGNTPSSDPKTVMVGDIWGLPQSGVDNLNNLEHDELGRHPPLASRSTVSASNEVPSQLSFSQADPDHVLSNEGTVSKKVTFGDLFKSTEVDEPDNRGHLNDREPSVNWNFKASATTTLDDPSSSYSPYLPPVLEEPSSSFSEAADDDPLPAIEGLQISGEAFPGQQLQACGYSINGTTSCNFEWVRHLEDGSFSYIDGAKQPNYLVTADDVGTYLAIEVQPLDDRKRKGELVKVFANEHMKITCDPVMHKCIEKTLYTGHASYQLSLSIGFIDIWEPALLAIKRDGYSIKCNGASGVIVTEKFSSSTTVSIPYGSPTEFSIVDSLGAARILRVDDSLTDISGSRDTIVLALRLFILKAGEKKRKKRSIFFNK